MCTGSRTLEVGILGEESLIQLLSYSINYQNFKLNKEQRINIVYFFKLGETCMMMGCGLFRNTVLCTDAFWTTILECVKNKI